MHGPPGLDRSHLPLVREESTCGAHTPSFRCWRNPWILALNLATIVTLLIMPFSTSFAGGAGPADEGILPGFSSDVMKSQNDGTSGGLVGPVWHWLGTQLNDGTAYTPTEADLYTLTFTAEGIALVRADCNMGNGPYTVDGNQISIQILAMTRAFCPPPSLSDTFVQQLSQVTSYSIRGTELLLELPVDSGTMRFAAPVMSSGDQPAEGSAVEALENAPWTLVEYAGPGGATLAVLPDTEITATFQNGRVTGSSGCNSYGAPYVANGSSIMILATAVTLRACGSPPGIMEQEIAYQAHLRHVSSFEATADQLTLYDDDGLALLTFVPQVQTPLEGTGWTVLDYNNGRGAVTSVMAGTELTAQFNGGSLTRSAGCNNYSASYALNGNNIAISPAATTRLFCPSPEGVMDQEGAYLAALERANMYRIEGDRLFLETAEGNRVASFIADSAEVAPDAEVASAMSAKITFDLTTIDDGGLAGPPSGLVSVAYEFCIPSTPAHVAEIQRIDPTAEVMPGAPGRIGCGPGELLVIGSTEQIGWRVVLLNLAALEYVTQIDRHFAE